MMDLSKPIADAYRALNVVRCCVMALDDDQHKNAADCHAIAANLENARGIVGSILDDMERANRAYDHPSEITEVLSEVKDIRPKRSAMVDANCGNDPMTREFCDLEDREEALCRRIGNARPKTDADAAAMLEWIEVDGEGQILCPLYQTAQKAVAEYLRGKAMEQET